MPKRIGHRLLTDAHQVVNINGRERPFLPFNADFGFQLGARSERGLHDNIVNAPLRAGDGGKQFRAAFETVILPRAAAFSPDFVVISAGFDAHMRDPLANLNLLEPDFAWATQKLMEIADASAKGRIVSVLEGGYDLQGLSRSVAAHVTTLMRG